MFYRDLTKVDYDIVLFNRLDHQSGFIFLSKKELLDFISSDFFFV